MKNLKKYEQQVWDNGSTWQRALIAYRHEAMNELTTDELNEIVNTLKEQNFYAQMSDSWAVTQAEMRQNNAIAAKAKELLEK